MTPTERKARARLAIYESEGGQKLREFNRQFDAQEAIDADAASARAVAMRDQYHDAPTPEEIADRAAAIRETWSKSERAKRNCHPNPESEILSVGRRPPQSAGFGGFTSDRIGADH